MICRRALHHRERRRDARGPERSAGAGVRAGRVVVTVCDPHFTFGGPSPEAERELPPGARYEDTFAWGKTVRATGRMRRDVHRPERKLRREFARAGWPCAAGGGASVDLEPIRADVGPSGVRSSGPCRRCPARSRCSSRHAPMEAATLDVQVPHLVSQLEIEGVRGAGAGRRRARGRIPQTAHAGKPARPAQRGAPPGRSRVDRPDRRRTGRRRSRRGAAPAVVRDPRPRRTPRPARRSPRRRRGSRRAGPATSSTSMRMSWSAGVSAATTIWPTCSRPLRMIRRHSRSRSTSRWIMTAYTGCGASGTWRVEVRAGMIDRVRLRNAVHCGTSSTAIVLRSLVPALDRAVAQGSGPIVAWWRSPDLLRASAQRAQGGHVAWLAVLDRIEHGVVPSVQEGQVEWTGGLADWMGPERREPFVFVVSGRNVPPGRLRRCIESMARQKGPRWERCSSTMRRSRESQSTSRSPAPRTGAMHGGAQPAPRRLLANMVTAVRMICTDPETVIVTLDADDALIGDRVLRAARGGVRARRGRDGRVDAAHRQGRGLSGLFRPAARTARRQRVAASALVPQAALRRRSGRGATARR